MKNAKRGAVEDAFTIIYLVMFLAILGVFGYLFIDKIMNIIDPYLAVFGVAPQLHAQATGAFQFIDGMVAFMLVLLIGGSLALAFFARSKPYLAVVAVFLQIFYIIGAYMMKVLWSAMMASSADINTVATNQFPISMLIMDYLPFICFLTLIGIIVLYFTKPRTDYVEGN